MRYDISYNPERDRWYLGASWAITPEPPASVEELRTGPVLGVDVNAEHLACCVLDARPSCSSIMAVSSRLLEGVKFCRRESRGHSCADPVPKHGPGPQIIGRTSDHTMPQMSC